MVTRFSDEDLDRAFRMMLESVPRQAVLMLDAEGAVARWNVGAEKLFGWREEEIVGRPGDALFTPEDRASGVPAREMQLAARAGHANDDRWHLRKDGSRLHVTGTMNAVRDDRGILRGFIKLVVDDTELVRAHERLQMAQSAGGVGSFELLVAEGRLHWSSELESMYGFAPGTFSGRYEDWRAMVHPEDLPGIEAEFAAATRERAPIQTRFRVRRRDGAERWMIGRGEAQYDGEGRPQRLVGVTLDITDQMRATEEAEKGRRTLSALLDQAPIGIVVVGRPPDHRIRHVSAFACRMLGRDCATLIGHRVGEHMEAWGLRHTDGSPVADPSRLPLVRALRGDVVANEEWVLTDGGGAQLPILVNAGPIREPDGGIVGGVLAFTDIGDRRQAEERLRAANQELEHFAFIASHDLQEPLRMIGSYLGLLQRKYAGHLDARANEYIGYATDGAERMQKLIRQLLDYARLERAEPNRVEIESRAALDDALTVLRERILESGGEVEIGPLPRVRADRDLLARLFQNLVGNAIKYSAKGRAPLVRVSAERGDAAWVFAVSDNGIGIAPEDRDRIFAVFQRLHTRDEYPGTGIGLAICKRIVDRHGGRIWVESNPGAGAIFRFTIPDAPGA